jgi:hypothetical protein
MPVSYRATVLDLLDILQREGGYRTPEDQVVIARARTLLAVQILPITVVVCNIPLCPSRLELGPLEPEAVVLEVERMRWWTDGHQHVCPSHTLMEGLR